MTGMLPHPGEGFHFLLVEGTDHDPVQIPGQHPGGVLHRFPPPDLQVVGGEEQAIPSQLIDAGFKRDPRAGRGFLENHAQRLARQQGMVDPMPQLIFELIGQIEDSQDLLFREIQQFEKMIHGKGSFLLLTEDAEYRRVPFWVHPGLSGSAASDGEEAWPHRAVTS